MIGLKIIGKVSEQAFEKFDALHYSIENKLLALIKSLQLKRSENTWIDQIRDSEEPYNTV